MAELSQPRNIDRVVHTGGNSTRTTMAETSKETKEKRLPSTERYLEYGETAVKLGLMIVGVGLGGSFAVFMLAVTIIVTMRMLGINQ